MNDALKKLVEKIPALPTIPAVAERIMQMASKDTTSMNAIVETIEQDPAISSKVIGVANAALFRTGYPVTSVKDAVMRVGFNTVRSIALSIAMLTLFKPGNPEQQRHYRHLFRHSIAVGVIARDMAVRLRWNSTENAFTAGLLHDLGLLVLNSYAPDLFKKLLDGAARGGYLDTLEIRVLGVSHGEIGTLIADRWHLPVELGEAIRHHHVPSQASRYRLMASLVHVADALAGRTGFPPLPLGFNESPIASDALWAIGLKDAMLEEIETSIRTTPIPDLAALG